MGLSLALLAAAAVAFARAAGVARSRRRPPVAEAPSLWGQAARSSAV